MRYAFSFILLGILCWPSDVKAQLVSSNHFFRERRFLFEVKQMDEFFERFNDVKTSFLRRNIRKYYPSVKIDRKSLLSTLFDNDNQKIRLEDKRLFIEAVNNPKKPLFLNFNAAGWLAEVQCVFSYKGKAITATVILEITTDSVMASRWTISRIISPKVHSAPGHPPLSKPVGSGRFLSPMSHATNFSGLGKVFEDKEHISEYVNDSFFTDSASLSFLSSCLRNDLSFQYVRSVSYSFTQIPGWRFRVNACTKDKSMNVGWLITDLVRSESKDVQQKFVSVTKAR